MDKLRSPPSLIGMDRSVRTLNYARARNLDAQSSAIETSSFLNTIVTVLGCAWLWTR